jgi:hypothetical protein
VPTAVAQAESRADAEFGIPTLASGFLGQLIGLGVHSEASLWGGYVAAAIATLMPLVAWQFIWRGWRAKRLAIEVAHYNYERSTRLATRSEKPNLEWLVSMGTGFGFEQREGESQRAYVERAFGITDVATESEHS